MDDSEERFRLKREILSNTRPEEDLLSQFQNIALLLYKKQKQPNFSLICECISFYSSWLRKCTIATLKAEILLILGDLFRMSQNLDARIYFESALKMADSSQIEKIYSFLSICSIESGNFLEAMKYLLLAVTKYPEQTPICLKNLCQLCSSSLSTGLVGFERFACLIILQLYSSKDRSRNLQSLQISEMNLEEGEVFALLWDFIETNQNDSRFGSLKGHLIRQLFLSCHSNQTLSKLFLLNFDQVIPYAENKLEEELSQFLKTLIKGNNEELKEKLAERGILQAGIANSLNPSLSDQFKQMQIIAQQRLNIQPNIAFKSVKEWYIPDANALVSGWPKLILPYHSQGLIVTKPVIEELDYQKIVNPHSREAVQQVLNLIDEQLLESPDRIKLLPSSCPETLAGKVKVIRGLYKYHIEMIRSIIAANSCQTFGEARLTFVSDSQVFTKALDENQLNHVTLDQLHRD